MLPLLAAATWLILSTSAADLGTTEWALRQPGTRELNPVMREPVARYAVKVAGTAVVIGTYNALRRRKKYGTAKAVAIAACTIWAGAAIHNLRQARR